jgi:hypothetical protein
MAHATQNFKYKKHLKAAVDEGKQVGLQEVMFPSKRDGPETVEGPWEYHRWYAEVVMKDGLIISVK